MAFLELCGVSAGYGPPGRRTEVLRDVNLTIERGEFVALVGYSGAGKSTLLSLVAGLKRPDAGTITLDGREIREPGPDRAVVFQNYSLLPWMTVYQNVALAVDQVMAARSAEERRAQVEKYIALVNLTSARNKRPSELSGGMRQRVSLARALATEPQVLLLDEPLSALDALTRATLQDELVRLWEQDHKTVLLITNDVDEGLLLADRIVPLGAGPAATLGPSQGVDIARPRIRRALNHEPRFREIRGEVIEYLLASTARRKKAAGAAAPGAIPRDIAAAGAEARA
jgi:nitrate/nitrite transport system ATP-binding protein